MKNVILLSLVLVAIGTGCTENEDNLELIIESRDEDFCDPGNMDPSSWCDGGADSWPSTFNIQSEPGDPGECCITIDITTSNGNTQVQFNTTNHYFSTGICSGVGNTYKVTTNGSGIVTVCWEPIGTHFLISIPGVGCYVFENPDASCTL